jgi:hypothetical protein
MKSKNKQPLSSYERAQKRIKEIKGFYGHLAAFIIVNLIVMFSRAKFWILQGNSTSLENVEFLNWIDWNIYGTPIIWGIFLAIHAINTFGKNPFLGRKWEERQIQKYMKQE